MLLFVGTRVHCIQYNASIFSEKHYQEILLLETSNIEEVQDKAYMALTTWTGMCLKDVHNLKSKDVLICAPSEGNGRHISLVTATRKNNSSGSGPMDGRRNCGRHQD